MPLSERLPAVVSTRPAPAAPVSPVSPVSLRASRSRPARAVSQPGRNCLRRAEKQIAEGAHAEAIASLEQAMRRGADAYACLLRIAQVHASARQWSQALAAAERAAHLKPDCSAAWECALTMAMAFSDRTRALAASEGLIKAAPRHVPAYQAQAEIYTALGQTEAALRAVNILTRLDPANGAHRVQKGLLLQHQGELALAMQEFIAAMSLCLDTAQAEIAMEALGTLDAHQLNAIVMLALDDLVFRARLARNAVEAAGERGFVLSPIGQHMMLEFCEQALPDMPRPSRPVRYN